jgi:Domain of unknown function (DUF4352)
MAGKICPKCGKTNPRFFTHCIECGAKLGAERKKAFRLNHYVKIVLALALCAVFIIFILIPFIQLSMHTGQSFSQDLRNKSEAEAQPVPEYPSNQPVDNGKLRIQVSSARDGQNTYNSQKFFIISVSLQNLQTDKNALVTNSDFELIGSDKNVFLPSGVSSKVQVDLSPGQSGNAEIMYVIPQTVSGAKLRFTFPQEYGMKVNRDVVLFNLQ